MSRVVVATLTLPIPARALEALVKALEKAYPGRELYSSVNGPILEVWHE